MVDKIEPSDLELIKTYGINREVPKIAEEDLKATSFIIIRHAYSEWNR